MNSCYGKDQYSPLETSVLIFGHPAKAVAKKPSNKIAKKITPQRIELQGSRLIEITADGEIWIEGDITADGEIWVAGDKEGDLTSDGEVWKAGDKIGDVPSAGEVWRNGNRIGTVNQDGTI